MNEQPNFFWRALRWFDPRGRTLASYGFMLNRLTALGLTLYLFMHLLVLGQLAKGPEAYEGFLAILESPLAVFGELLVVAAVFIHGLNGIRIFLTSFGIAVPHQRALFIGLMALSGLAIILFAVRMFGQ